MITSTIQKPTPRLISDIRLEILSLWRKPYFGAIPYLDAMKRLETIDDEFGYDTAKEIIRYFLSNTSQFKGEDARRIKKELNDMIK